MKTSITKKIIVVIMAIFMVAGATACDSTEEVVESTATMAPETTEAVEDATATAEPTETPDPLAALRYWEIDTDKSVYNILLLGLDELDGTTWARNDTTMILQVDLENNTMKLVSFMRDMLVDIPGQGTYRINNAHYRGGPDLAVETIEEVFDVDIDGYAVVTFVTFEQVMANVIGTIEITVEDYEVEHLQAATSAVSMEGEQIGGQGVVTSEGTYEFNEYLALSYARDRHSSGEDNEKAGDYGRNERQRTVVMAAWDAVKEKSLSLIPASVFMAVTYIETDMSEALIITLVKAMMENDAEIEDMAMPVSGRYWSAWVNDDGVVYTGDELEALYQTKKDAYEAKNSTTDEEGNTVSTTDEEFPDYEDWRSDNEYSNVIDWSSSNINALHEFLGID